MSTFFNALLTTSLAMSAVILLMLLLNKLLDDKVPASFRYYMWFVVLIGLLIPFRPGIPVPFGPVQMPALFETAYTEPAGESAQTTPHEAPRVLPPESAGVTVNEKPAVSYKFIMLGVWLTGMLGVLALHLRAYGKFISAVRRWSTETSDGYTLSIMRATAAEMGLQSKQIPIKTCVLVSSPMLIGFFRPAILLPETAISADELEYVLKHELTHYKRKDLWMNLLVLLVSAMYWFNPLVYLMAKTIREDCEASCDEMVIAGNDAERRRQYGETIIGFIGAKNVRTPVLSTYFYGGTKSMKKRLGSIMDTSRKNTMLAAACSVIVVLMTLLSGNAIAATGQYIGETRAKAIALEHSGITEQDAAFVNVHLDREDGRMVYDVEFYSGNAEYDYEIDAVNGRILEYDMDIENYSIPRNSPVQSGRTGRDGQYIGEARAKSIALSSAGLAESNVSRMRIKLDREHRTMVYEIEFRNGRTEYEYEIDAESGAILKSQIEQNNKRDRRRR